MVITSCPLIEYSFQGIVTKHIDIVEAPVLLYQIRSAKLCNYKEISFLAYFGYEKSKSAKRKVSEPSGGRYL